MDTNTPMTEERANEVLRTTAQHLLTAHNSMVMQMLYGENHQRASELIKEALAVSQITHRIKDKGPPTT